MEKDFEKAKELETEISQCEEAATAVKETSEINSGLGKFRDAESLKKAYDSLSSEFTKRCQKIKELEGLIAAKDKESGAAVADGDAVRDDGINVLKEISEETKKTIVKEYLNEIAKNSASKIAVGSGAAVKTPCKKPRTFEEAGKMVKKFLIDKEN